MPQQPAGRAGPADRGHVRSSASRDVDELFELVRGAAPFARLPRRCFEGVLDMLAGRYPSDEFAELRPRITWDRLGGLLRRRDGACTAGGGQRRHDPRPWACTACSSARATASDAAACASASWTRRWSSRAAPARSSCWGPRRGASTEITRDRVLVDAGPGPARQDAVLAGDRGARPLELGRAIGRLTRELAPGAAPRGAAPPGSSEHCLEPRAADNLLGYLETSSAPPPARCPTTAPS